MKKQSGFSKELLVKAAAWFEARAKKTKCPSCQRRALGLARFSRRVARNRKENG